MPEDSAVQQPSPLCERSRFPAAIVGHAVWLDYRFLLSSRDVEELRAERGIAVSSETIRRRRRWFGQTFADGERRRRPRPGDRWHLDEAQLRLDGPQHWLSRAGDQDGIVLDNLVRPRRDQAAAGASLRRLVDGQGSRPRVVVTDDLASYPPALRRVLPGAEHRRHEGLQNRAENSPRPPRRRERVLRRFESPEHAQRSLAPCGPLPDHVRPRRHLLPAPTYRQLLRARVATRREATGLSAASPPAGARRHTAARQPPISAPSA
jgi:putative transposase